MPDGEIHPEQADALKVAQQEQTGKEGQGMGVDMMNAASTAAPVPSLPPSSFENEKSGEDGDRGLGSMIGGMMSKNSHAGYSGQQPYQQQQQYGYNVSD
jgi:hypothetical protein